MYFVYVLYSKKDMKLYTGRTTNLKQRISDHNCGNNISTRHRRPLELIYYEAYKEELDAEGRERYLKSGSGKKHLQKQLSAWFAKNPYKGALIEKKAHF